MCKGTMRDWVLRRLSLIPWFMEMLQLFFAKSIWPKSWNLHFYHSMHSSHSFVSKFASFQLWWLAKQFPTSLTCVLRLVAEIALDFPSLLKLLLGFLISYSYCYLCIEGWISVEALAGLFPIITILQISSLLTSKKTFLVEGSGSFS